MQLMSQFEKFHLYGLLHSAEYSLEGVLVGEVPLTSECMNFPQATLLGHHFIVRLDNFKQYQFISMYFMLFPMNRLGK